MPGTPTVLSSARAMGGTQGVLAAGIRPDKAVNVAQLEENTAPLLLMTKKMNKKPSINPTFSHFEDEPMPYWDAINNGAGYSSTDTALVVDNGTFFAANYLVIIPRTLEIIRVTSVSTNTLTAARGVAGSTAAAILDDDDLRIIGTAYAGGASKGTMKSTQKTEVTGYCQIFRDTFGVTKTEAASEMYWGKDMPQERMERGVDHAISLESGFIFGKASIDTSGGTPIWYTGGVIDAISTNTTAVNGFLDLDSMDTFIRTGFRYNSTRGKNLKWFFCSRLVASAINAFARDAIRTIPRDAVFGIKMQEYQNIHGTIAVIPHNLLEDHPLAAGLNSEVFGGYGIMVDPSSPRYRYLQTRDTKLLPGIETPGDDLIQEEYLSQVGLQFRMEEWNSLMTGVNG